MSKTIIITEAQQSEITQNLISACGSVKAYLEKIIPILRKTSRGKKVFYDLVYTVCKQIFGDCISRGTSRYVFQIDDERVIKVARNDKGIAQNREEVRSCSNKLDLFPKIFDADRGYMWIVCEYVLPADEDDFIYTMGMQWDYFIRFLNDCYNLYKRKMNIGTNEKKIEKIISKRPMLQELIKYLNSGNIPYGDLMKIENWGLAKRNGRAYLVLLDHGITEEIFNNHYRY